MPFIGTLNENLLFTLDVTPEVTLTGDAAVTVSYLNSTGNKVRDIDILTMAKTDPGVALSRVTPSNTSRIYIEIDMPVTGLATARVTQGALVYTSDLIGDTRLVFDVVQ